MFSTAFGFGVFLVFLLFTVQLLVGLYARTTATAVASDAARRAATLGDALTPADVRELETDVARRVGGDAVDAEASLSTVDDDGDGEADRIAVTVRADLPTLLPARLVPNLPLRVDRTVSARLEREPVP